MKSPLVMRLLRALLDDFKRVQPDVKGVDRDYVTIEARFEHEGVGFISVALPTLCDSLDLGLATGRFACPHGFKRIRGGALPRIFSGLLCDVFEAKTGSLKEAPCVGAIKCLREVLRLFKKFQATTDREEQLHRTAVGTFWDAEAYIRESVQDPRRRALLSHVSGLLLSSLDSHEPSKIFPRHGPGAVFEKMAPNQKWSGVFNSFSDATVDVVHFGFDMFWASERALNIFDAGYSDSDAESASDASGTVRDAKSSLRSPLSKCARLVSVPKNSVSRRTITVEPLMNMFIQQGLNTVLRSAIERCPVLSNCLALTDQTKNQVLALEGSRTGEWATLDLSSASDLLSLDLVELVFARHPRFLRDMIECRTSHVLDGSRQVEVKKFAGMGNALTFPVQSVVFAALAITAQCEALGRSRPSLGTVKRIAKTVRVYGDDIIVRTSAVHRVVEWIGSFGLKVNQKKSFSTGNFRESCGVDAFRGYDVTPVYLRHDPQSSRDVKAIANLVAVSNQLWFRGLYSAATLLQDEVEGLLGRSLPIAPVESGSLSWATRLGHVTRQKWCKHTHQFLYKGPVVLSQTVKDPLDGWPALLKFFLTPLIERSKDHLKRSTKRFNTRIVWRWKPARAGRYLVTL